MSSSARSRKPAIDASWLAALATEFDAEYMQQLRDFLEHERRRGALVFPPMSQVFAAFNTTPLDAVRVVIVGQDPYHGLGQAMGLSFSVPAGVAIPPSLKNMSKELVSDVGIAPLASGDLTGWAEQGVLLLNTSLTVRAGEAASHRGKGWEQLTDAAIAAVDEQCEHVVFLLWGRHARNKAAMIDQSRHLVLEAAHPSPLSAHNGFFGCRHFSQANEYLATHGRAPIDWARHEGANSSPKK